MLARVAARHGGIAHRTDLRRAGVTRADLRTEIRAGRWHLDGLHTVSQAGCEISGEARWWRAVWESGPGAALDGVSALEAAGLQNFDDSNVHVSIPSANRTHVTDGVTVHRLNDVGPLISEPIRRVPAEVACLRAAAWATTDRTAALIIAMSVQQRLVDEGQLRTAWGRVGYSTRREVIERSIRDVCDGAESLGELDFGRLCVAYGLPTPDRQLRRRRPNGVAYIDAGWEEIGLLVEIDGSQHSTQIGVVEDALRQNDVMMGGGRVLRIPLFGLRHHPEKFMVQVVRAYRNAA